MQGGTSYLPEDLEEEESIYDRWGNEIIVLNVQGEFAGLASPGPDGDPQ